MPVEELSSQLTRLSHRLERLPDPEEPPPTTLQILGRSRREGDWQALLAYFLTPSAAHGLDHCVAEQFLDGLTNREDVDFEYSPFDLDDIEVATEVPVAYGRLDLVMWSGEEWFVVLELKIDASEGDGQTQKYADSDAFGSIPLDPTDVPPAQRQYLFVTPDGAQSDSETFIPITWSWIADQLRIVRSRSHGGFPARTTSQLDDFIDTIETELTMTEHEANQAAKAALYVDHYPDIAAVQTAFESEWTDLIDTWGRRLAAELDGVRVVEDPDGVPAAPDDDVLLAIVDGPDRERYWLAHQGSPKWAWLFPTDWWQDPERNEPVYRNTKPNARVGFLHRPNPDRESVLDDGVVPVYLRNAPSGNDAFYPEFARRFNADDGIVAAIPDRTERPGRKSNVLEARYPVALDDADDVTDAYIEALATAVDEHVLSNHRLVARIDELYAETFEESFSP